MRHRLESIADTPPHFPVHSRRRGKQASKAAQPVLIACCGSARHDPPTPAVGRRAQAAAESSVAQLSSRAARGWKNPAAHDATGVVPAGTSRNPLAEMATWSRVFCFLNKLKLLNHSDASKPNNASKNESSFRSVFPYPQTPSVIATGKIALFQEKTPPP